MQTPAEVLVVDGESLKPRLDLGDVSRRRRRRRVALELGQPRTDRISLGSKRRIQHPPRAFVHGRNVGQRSS